jgi:DeoR/GlpR family transcriptional regulator of sugar metabolism
MGDLAEIELNRDERKRARMFLIIEFLADRSRVGDVVSFGAIRKHCEDKLGKAAGATLSDDLNYLTEELGIVEKPRYGSYRLLRSLSLAVFANSEYMIRRKRNVKEKELVAHACIAHRRDDGKPLLGGRFCLISQGTSTEPLFRELRMAAPEQLPERVITNSLPGILELLSFPLMILSIIGGRADRESGGIRPIVGGVPNGSWPLCEGFNTVILSCSSVASNGAIWCGDGMELFRSSLLGRSNVDLVILTDTTKLVLAEDESEIMSSGGGDKVTTRISWDERRTWLFVNKSDNPKHEEIFNEFKNKLGNHFVKA